MISAFLQSVIFSDQGVLGASSVLFKILGTWIFVEDQDRYVPFFPLDIFELVMGSSIFFNFRKFNYSKNTYRRTTI